MASPEEIGKALQQEIERLRVKEEEQQKTINALKQEFTDANTSLDPEAVAKVARKAIIDIMPKAIIQLGQLIEYAESESVRAGLSKFVIACGLDKSKFEDVGTGSLAALVKELAKND
jgi:hypothetical protein